MIILDTTTKSLQFKLGGAITTNQLPFAASYIDTTGTGTTPIEQDGASNNTTAVTVVGSPAASTQRLVKSIVIQNADTAAATVSIIYNNNSTLRNVIVVALAIGDQLVYEDGNGWLCIDKNGNLKTSGSGGGAVSSVSNSDGTLTISPTTGAVVASLALGNANTWSGAQSFNSGDFILKGATSGTVTVKPAAVAGSNTLTLPAGTTDFSSTGGTSQVVKQTSAGGALTVGQLAAADLSNYAATTYTATLTNWTFVGGNPTVTASYTQIGRFVAFNIKIVPATTVASSGSNVVVSLPTSVTVGSFCGITDDTTGASLGTGCVDSNGSCYMPSISATGHTLYISGFYW